MATATRIVVKFSATGASSPSLAGLIDQVAALLNGTLVRPPSRTGRAVFEVPASSDVDRLIEDVSRLPSVEYAERDTIDRAQS
jgi:hypothetical protein